MTTSTVQTNYDPLDLNSYSLNRLPKKKLTKTGAFFKKWGLPIAAILFFVLAYVAGRTHQKLSNEPRYRSPFIGDLTRGTF